jgi:hypothetical protein
MPDRIFDRSFAGSHPLEQDLDLWLSGRLGDPHPAMACNLVHDHRVSPEREAKLLDYFAKAGKRPGKRLHKALEQYHLQEVRSQKRPDFLEDKLNASNILPEPRQFGLRRIALSPAQRQSTSGPAAQNLWLVRLLDLNRLFPVFLRARSSRLIVFRDYPRSAGDSHAALAWLDSMLGGAAPRYSQEYFAAAVIDALELARQNEPFHPTWATYWNHFESYLSSGPVRWASALGFPNGKRCGRWVMVLKYSRAEAGRLVRPTILDAGFNQYHFPSPPQAPLERGGHPMDLQLNPLPTDLLPEFIHQQIPHTVEHWVAAGRLLGRIPEWYPRRGWLKKWRGNHHDLLIRSYGPGVRAWMNRYV